MNNTCTVIKSYIVVANHIPALFSRIYIVEQRYIFSVFKVSTNILFNNFILTLTKHLIAKSFCKDILVFTALYLYILGIRVYTKSNV